MFYIVLIVVIVAYTCLFVWWCIGIVVNKIIDLAKKALFTTIRARLWLASIGIFLVGFLIAIQKLPVSGYEIIYIDQVATVVIGFVSMFMALMLFIYTLMNLRDFESDLADYKNHLELLTRVKEWKEKLMLQKNK